MQPSAPDELERAGGLSEPPPAPDLPTQQISVPGRYCGACGASMAPDQRYCVECGQRRGPAHPAVAGQSVQRMPAAVSPAPRRRGPRLNVNAALIAGVGTLMLAMGTGVLIGRTAASGDSGTVQYLTVPGSGVGTSSSAGASGSTTPGQTGSGEAGNGSAGSGSKGGSSAGSKAKAKHKGGSAESSSSSSSGSEEGPGSEKAVVKIGEAGKGPGYKKGHFTGEFFGSE